MKEMFIKSGVIGCLLLNLVSFSVSLEYEKNKDILSSEKGENSRVFDDEEVKDLDEKISTKPIVVAIFFAEWCGHCKTLLPKYVEVSKYSLANNVYFTRVNCKNKEICSKYEITKFPTVKVYNKGILMENEPGREVQDILEYLDKLSQPDIIQLKSLKQANKFSTGYGDSSFILFDYNNSTFFYDCVNKLAGNKFKAEFYFGFVSAEVASKNLTNLEFPRLQVTGKNQQVDNHKILTNNTECEEIEEFIDSNRFPILKKLDTAYIRKLQKGKKTILIASLNYKNQSHIKFLKDIFLEALKNHSTHAVNVFIDYEEDKQLYEYFKITDITNPRMILYDFATSRYHLDTNIYDNEENQRRHIKELLTRIKTGEISMLTGNFVEDFIARLGFEVTPTTMSVIFIGFVVILVVLVIIIIYCFDEKGENPNAANEQATSTEPNSHSNSAGTTKANQEVTKEEKQDVKTKKDQ